MSEQERTPEQLEAYIEAAYRFHESLTDYRVCSPLKAQELLAVCGVHVDLGAVMDGCERLTLKALRQEKLDLYRQIYESQE